MRAAKLPALSILLLPPRAKEIASPTTLLPQPLGPTTATKDPGPGSGPHTTCSWKHLNPVVQMEKGSQVTGMTGTDGLLAMVYTVRYVILVFTEACARATSQMNQALVIDFLNVADSYTQCYLQHPSHYGTLHGTVAGKIGWSVSIKRCDPSVTDRTYLSAQLIEWCCPHTCTQHPHFLHLS